MPPLDDAPVVVLDANVVLDWLVFRHAGCSALALAVETGRLHWLATAAMRDELDHVLARGFGPRWAVDPAAVDAAWRRWATVVAAPTVALTAPRCSDPADQMFVDLALAAPARWLITRDRALLKLARRLRAHGVDVLTPEAWQEKGATEVAP